jgi:hypothetical protein
VRRVVSWVAVVAVASAACGGNVEPMGDGGTESGATLNRCPSSLQSVSVCAPTPGGVYVNDNPTLGCALDALPSGLPCSGAAQCSMLILPCLYEVQTWAGAGRVDVYVCTCVGLHWSCEDCDTGAVCAEGTDAALLDAPPPSGGDAVSGKTVTDVGYVPRFPDLGTAPRNRLCSFAARAPPVDVRNQRRLPPESPLGRCRRARPVSTCITTFITA